MRLARFLSGVLPLLVLAAACGEAGGPFAGAERGAPVEARKMDEGALRLTSVERVAAYKATKARPENLWAKAWIGPNGGTLEYYGFRIVVPAGAVSKVTMFSISLPKEGTERALAEFGPHNVAFAQPITVELPYVGTTAEGYGAGVLWYDESANVWTPVGGSLTADGQRVQTQMGHFSVLGTNERGGGMSTGGG